MTSSGLFFHANASSQASNDDLHRTDSASSIRSTHRSSSPKQFRIANLKGFLPLNETSGPPALSTRGQNLPHLLGTGLTRKNSGIWYHEHESRTSSTDLRGMGMTMGFGNPPSDRNSRRRSIERPKQSRDDDENSLDEGGLGMTMGFGRDPLGGIQRRMSLTQDERAQVLMQTRSQRLIGNSNPRYRWDQYWKTEEELKTMKKPMKSTGLIHENGRKYYERNNSLIQQYTFIDRLLDSSLPHQLIQEYQNAHSAMHQPNIPETIRDQTLSPPTHSGTPTLSDGEYVNGQAQKVKRTPKNLYQVRGPSQESTAQDESTPLLKPNVEDPENPTPISRMPEWEPEGEANSTSRIVSVAIYVNLAANTILLILKIIVVILSSSVSVLASMVDAALDFLSTAIVFVTTRIINRKSAHDREKYPVGRRKLEPIGVLVFSVIMVTAFVQVAIEGFGRLTSGSKEAVQLSTSAIVIMACTVGIKGLCWVWCKAIKNSSVQALAQDAMTDVIFNIFSIIFPLIGYYADIWFLDPLGGILLSCYVILNWSFTCSFHISQLTGAAASADERNVLLYLTMRFAKTIKQIQGLNAYHAGDKLNVEVDVVLDENTSLRDSHDLGESLQYVLESVPYVDRAFVHADYAGYNLPSHMEQQED